MDDYEEDDDDDDTLNKKQGRYEEEFWEARSLIYWTLLISW